MGDEYDNTVASRHHIMYVPNVSKHMEAGLPYGKYGDILEKDTIGPQTQTRGPCLEVFVAPLSVLGSAVVVVGRDCLETAYSLIRINTD